jgi:hypothetical protein
MALPHLHLLKNLRRKNIIWLTVLFTCLWCATAFWGGLFMFGLMVGDYDDTFTACLAPHR